MKKSFLFILTLVFLSSCDPVADMEANIENKTTQDLKIEFISSDQDLTRTLQIFSNETKLFQDVFDVGNDFLQPSLIEYDSVVIRNKAEQIVRVYKLGQSGKNIYNIDDYWLSSEPYKRGFRYEYEILEEDLE